MFNKHHPERSASLTRHEVIARFAGDLHHAIDVALAARMPGLEGDLARTMEQAAESLRMRLATYGRPSATVSAPLPPQPKPEPGALVKAIRGH
jgi:hypothetical protein